MKTLAACCAFTTLIAMSAPESDAGSTAPADPSASTSAKKMSSGVTTWDEIQARIKPTKTGQRRDVFTTLDPGQNTGALHRHPQEELVIIKEGTLEINIDGKKRIAGPGSMIFYAANENENMTNVGKTPATYYVLQWFTALTPKE